MQVRLTATTASKKKGLKKFVAYEIQIKRRVGMYIVKAVPEKRIKTFDCFTVSNTKQSSSKNHNHMNCSILFPVNFSFPDKILSQILRAQIVQTLHNKFDEFSTVAIWLHNHVTKLAVKGVPTKMYYH